MSGAPKRQTVYVGLDEQAMCALDAEDGSLIWRQTLQASPSFPIATDSAVYAITIAGTIHAWQRPDGTPLWTQTATAEFPSPPAHTAGRVCVSTFDGELHAFEAGSGALVWRQAVKDLMRAQPLAQAGHVYVVTESGDVAAFAAADGVPLWYAPRLGDTGITCLAATASVLIARSLSGKLVAVRADNGNELWRHHDGCSGMSNPTVDNERIYLTCHQGVGRSAVRAVHIADGAVAWEVHSRKGALSNSQSVDGRLFVAAGHNGVFEVQAYDVADGRQLWRWQTTAAHGGITPPTATRERVYISVDRDGVYALRATDGRVLWHALQGTMGTAVAAI